MNQTIIHKTLGIGQIINKETTGNYCYITAHFNNGQDMRFSVPESFRLGIITADEALQEEVSQAIDAQKARLIASRPAKPAPAGMFASRSANRSTINNPISAEFETFLVREGYSIESPSGHPSTVAQYLRSVDEVRAEEGLTWNDMITDICTIIPMYDFGGCKEDLGNRGHRTVVNALFRFKEYTHTL